MRDKLSIDKQLTFKRGHDVGYFAQQLFAGGTDVSKLTKNVTEACQLTQELLSQNVSIIYEATFVYNNTLIMVDILVNENGLYKAYEVKSSLKVSEIYLRDACLQYYVLKNALPGFEDLFLVTMNGNYELNETIEPKQLFKKRSVKKEGEENLSYFESKIKDGELLLEQNVIPNTAIGKQCFKPYQCDFIGTCWKDKLNDQSIFNLPLISREKLFEWYEQGVSSINQLNDDLLENEIHRKIKKAFDSQSVIIKPAVIKRFLAGLKTPLAAMDMEVWAPAIPEIKGAKPFQQIPFLFCITSPEKETHSFFTHSFDDREAFALSLIKETSSFNSILVYDKTMEVIAIDNLAGLFPHLAEPLTELKAKLADLFELVRDIEFYHPSMKSNFSLKSVSEVINSGVFYEGIRSGLEAMSFYEALRGTEIPEEKENLTTQLIEYCLNDCRATYSFFEYLQKV